MTKLGAATTGAEEAEARKYERPELIALGSLLDLTAKSSGEGDDSESAGSQ